MKNKRLYIIASVLIITILSIAFSVYEYIHLKIQPVMDFNSDPVLVAHAMGGLENAKYSNSLEAFKTNYKKGYRIFEADIIATSDNVLVLRHDWIEDYGQNLNLENGNIPTYKEFMKAPMYGKYTPLSLKDVFKLMKKHKDIYLITDTKEYAPAKTKALFEQILADAESVNATNCLDRVIVQIYNNAMYDAVMEVYPFKQIIYTLYVRGTHYFEQLCQFCVERDINIITMDYKQHSQKLQAIADEYNIKTFVHTINKKKRAKKFYNRGVTGIYTDKLTSASFEE